MCQSLPRTSAEAAYTRAEIYKQLPSVFMAWFSLVLCPNLSRQQNFHRNERECRTIVEVLDKLLAGDTMAGIMLLLGRLKALTAVVISENSWSVAQNHEVLRSNRTGLISEQDQRAAQRDHYDQQKLARGAGMPGREPQAENRNQRDQQRQRGRSGAPRRGEPAPQAAGEAS